MDIQNAVMDTHDSIMDIHYPIIDIHNSQSCTYIIKILRYIIGIVDIHNWIMDIYMIELWTMHVHEFIIGLWISILIMHVHSWIMDIHPEPKPTLRTLFDASVFGPIGNYINLQKGNHASQKLGIMDMFHWKILNDMIYRAHVTLIIFW